MLVGEEMFIKHLLEFLQRESKESLPQHQLAVRLAEKLADEQDEVLEKITQEFMTHYGYGTVNCPKNNDKLKVLNITKPGGHNIIIRYAATVSKPEPDELYNNAIMPLVLTLE